MLMVRNTPHHLGCEVLGDVLDIQGLAEAIEVYTDYYTDHNQKVLETLARDDAWGEEEYAIRSARLERVQKALTDLGGVLKEPQVWYNPVMETPVTFEKTETGEGSYVGVKILYSEIIFNVFHLEHIINDPNYYDGFRKGLSKYTGIQVRHARAVLRLFMADMWTALAEVIGSDRSEQLHRHVRYGRVMPNTSADYLTCCNYMLMNVVAQHPEVTAGTIAAIACEYLNTDYFRYLESPQQSFNSLYKEYRNDVRAYENACGMPFPAYARFLKERKAVKSDLKAYLDEAFPLSEDLEW